MRTAKVRVVVVLMLLLAAILLVPLAIVIVNRPRVPAVTLPTPNAFDTLRDAGTQVTGIPEDYDENSDPVVLQGVLASNVGALELLQEARNQDCLVPIDYERGFDQLDDAVGPVRQAMRLAYLHARLAEVEGDLGVAALRYADMFAMAVKTREGGVLVTLLAAAGSEKMALFKLGELIPRLEEGPVREDLRQALRQVDRKLADLDAILDREAILAKKEHGTLMGTWMLWMTGSLTEPARARARQVDAEVQEAYAEAIRLLE